MLLLLIFALVAGAGTAITPCVLPVLPALLSASAVGGRRRPLGIVLGLALTFTITIVLLSQLVNGVGLGSSATRILAFVVLISFGLIMLLPPLAQRVQAPLSRLARFGPKTRGDGFWSGLGVGAALGFVCAPCAGPILAAVIATSASRGPSVRAAAVGVAYAIGLSAVLLLYGFGGRALLNRIRRTARGDLVERALGIVLVATGIAIAFNLDVRFENVLAPGTGKAPGFLIDPTAGLESSSAIRRELASLQPASKFAKRQQHAGSNLASLAKLGRAPNFTNTQDWFNTPADRPLTLTGLRGHVVLVDFWTYTCINCIRTLPFVEGLYKHYHRYGLDVVGVETPEFTFEQEAGNVRQAIHTDGITYPVVQDNRYGTWNAYGNQYWPAEYYIDAAGEVRRYEPGEGGYARDEQVVRALLRASGAHTLPPLMTARARVASKRIGTLETYLNPQRQSGFVEPLQRGTFSYSPPRGLSLDQWALGGSWTVASQSITPSGSSATISGNVQARDVYLVMTSAGNKPRRGRLLLGGKPIPAADRGSDVSSGGYFTVRGQRLYNLVRLRGDATFTITVELPRGIHAYDFTFG
ncbi:MAG TPA: cytochrome c biogenesis protein CcdA [Solirubrobacteraceae bacterium]|nr:cytochrome c biogenesis protein CcdA [Solirubrobacteraceae bacterium]